MINALMACVWVVVLPDWVRLRLAAWGLGVAPHFAEQVDPLLSCHGVKLFIRNGYIRVKPFAPQIDVSGGLLEGWSSHVSGWWRLG